MYDYGANQYFPFQMNSAKKMQFAEVTHLEFLLEARLQLVDHIQIVDQNDEVVYKYDYNYN